ncbi:MAG: 3-deoxy-7-phosphoheptulonate synthase [Vicinamibacteria bacterium]|nr:3-deoxy-7-phosphoheptulonate synthase [Vicinamibacteria bacterium]
MIIVMRADLPEDSPELRRVIAHAESYPGISTQIHRIQGATRSLTEIYLLGPTGAVPTGHFEEFDAVEKVVRITQKYRFIGRHDGALEAVGFEYNGVSPYDFQGHGAACLPFVFELAGKYGIRIISMEVTHESHIDEILRALDQAGRPTGVMLQIGTRNAQNFELLKAVGQQTELPVLFKRGMGITLEESLNACEYVASSGNRRIIFCLRGMRSNLGDPHRNFVDFAHVPVVQRLTRMPVCIDPSHSVGRRAIAPDGLLDIFHVTAQGIIAGANMVLVDFHPRPEQAVCDGPQALLVHELEALMDDIRIVRRAYEERVKRAKKTE